MVRSARVLVSVLMTIGLFLPWTVLARQGYAATPNPVKVAELKMALRDLYVGHIFWVRDLVSSTRLGEKGAVSEADEYGVKNAQAIGRSIAPFYGQAAGEKFATLFVGHYSAVKDYMKAAFAANFKGNATLKKAAMDKMTKNGNEIAVFVSSANPNLPKDTVYGLLVTHVQQHIMSIDAVAKKDWGGEADMWDPMVKHIYTLTDALADGIAKQFPEKFQ
ncbi:MAG TPA: hypothetical protein VHM88_19360 [Candidatus Acidoferrales bacterium]|nr:hypothetical protein [Candidatus Acidoferrales bacterium]